MTSQTLNRKDAAKYIGVAESTFDILVAKGSIPITQPPGLKWPRYMVKRLDEFLDRHTHKHKTSEVYDKYK